MAKLPQNAPLTTTGSILPLTAFDHDQHADIVGKPKQFEKTTKIWKALRSKFKFDFIRKVLKNCKSFCANRQSFIDAIAAHSKCLSELYLFGAYFVLLLAVNMLAIALIGLGNVVVTIVNIIAQLVAYLLARFTVLYNQRRTPLKDKYFIKFTPTLLTESNIEKIQNTVDVLRKRRTAKFAYLLLTISLCILLCALATILMDILLLKGCPLLESIYEFQEMVLFTLFQLAFAECALVFGLVFIHYFNADFLDKDMLKFLEQFDIVYCPMLVSDKCHVDERIQQLFYKLDDNDFEAILKLAL